MSNAIKQYVSIHILAIHLSVVLTLRKLDKAPPSPHGHSAKADCSAYQIASVTPCPSTVTKTVDGPVETVTITSTYGQPVSTPKAIVSKRSKIHEANVNSCATTGKAAGIPVYATKDCKPADYASACSCLGIKQSTTTLARSIITSTYSAKSTTVRGFAMESSCFHLFDNILT